MDQTFAELVPASCRTMEEKGADKVPIEGTEDKRGITVVLTSSKGGEKSGPEMLPTQALGGWSGINFATP